MEGSHRFGLILDLLELCMYILVCPPGVTWNHSARSLPTETPRELWTKLGHAVEPAPSWGHLRLNGQGGWAPWRVELITMDEGRPLFGSSVRERGDKWSA